MIRVCNQSSSVMANDGIPEPQGQYEPGYIRTYTHTHTFLVMALPLQEIVYWGTELGN